MENTSGSGDTAVVPAEIDRWNWGAFLLTWIWGIGNNTYIAFLMFVPFVNLAMPFVLGAKGSAWAWRNKRWASVEAFQGTQRKWARWGLVALTLAVVLAAGIAFAVIASLKNSDAYQMTVRAMHSNPRIVQVLGEPITTGIPTGNIRVSGPDGEANLAFGAEGPKGSGTIYVNATKSLGQWKIDAAVFQNDKDRKRIEFGE